MGKERASSTLEDCSLAMSSDNIVKILHCRAVGSCSSWRQEVFLEPRRLVEACHHPLFVYLFPSPCYSRSESSPAHCNVSSEFLTPQCSNEFVPEVPGARALPPKGKRVKQYSSWKHPWGPWGYPHRYKDPFCARSRAAEAAEHLEHRQRELAGRSGPLDEEDPMA